MVVGNAVARIEAGEAASVKINRATRTAQVVATKGVIEVSAQGKRVRLKPGNQTTVGPNVPPSPPIAAPPMRIPPAVPGVRPTPVVSPPPPPPAPPKPPKYQVAPNVPPPTPATEPEEYHGQQPTSPAE